MQNSVLNSPYSCFLLCLDRRKNLTVMVGAHDHSMITLGPAAWKSSSTTSTLGMSLRVCEMTSYYFREMTEIVFFQGKLQ